jgi:signal transduction histidine kinase
MEPSATSQETAPPPAAFHKRKVKNYLINTKLQLRFASWLLAVAAMISVVLGYVLWRSYAETSRVVALMDPEAADSLAAAFASEDRARMVWLAAALAVVLVCLLGFAVVMTHRIAGPAFVIARTCRQVADGNFERPRPLRERDMLVELGDDVAHMVDAVRDRDQDERDRLAAAIAVLAGAGAGAEERQRAIEALQRLADEKTKRLAT